MVLPTNNVTNIVVMNGVKSATLLICKQKTTSALNISSFSYQYIRYAYFTLKNNILGAPVILFNFVNDQFSLAIAKALSKILTH